jgi:predicted dehydrogenase
VSAFRTLPENGHPLRVILVGAGPWGCRWLRDMNASAEVEAVGLVEVNLENAQTALREEGLTGIPIAKTVTELLETVAAEAVVNATVPAAHHAVTTEALLAGLPVLSEKPIAPTVAEGLSLAAAAELTGQLFMVSQSYRYRRRIRQFKNTVAGLGEVGIVTTQFFKAPRIGGWRDAMAHPLLVDMAIHAFDAFRYLVDDEPVSVLCEEFNPPWSWYEGDAGATASFLTASGSRFVYTGTWCSPGLETSWQGDWRVSASRGSATWNGLDEPIYEADVELSPDDPGEIPEEIAGALAEFVHALRTGTVPLGLGRWNISSLAMVEAAIRSSELGTRIDIGRLKEAALAQAIDKEKTSEVAEILRGWIGTEI